VLGAASPPSLPDIPERAFRQEPEADLSLKFTSWDDIDAYPGGRRDDYRRNLTRSGLQSLLHEVPMGRNLCVVIFSKRADSADLDEIEASLRREGFRRVTFERHVGKPVEGGRPILRE
jgi:hypothetical protein